MTRLGDPIAIDAKAPLLEAMAKMASGGGRLLVMQDGKLVGFLTLTSVIRNLRVRQQLLSERIAST